MALLLLACLAVAAAPAIAHGPEEHGETKAEAASLPAEAMRRDAASAGNEEFGAAGETQAHEIAAGDPGGVFGILKNLHPATVHFPIALFIMAALTELFAIARPASRLEPAVRVMIYGGAAGAVIAALFGWIHTGLWLGGDMAMHLHRWTGTAIAACGLVLAVLAWRDGGSRTGLRVLLFAIAAALFVQGYLGGELAHGPNHLET